MDWKPNSFVILKIFSHPQPLPKCRPKKKMLFPKVSKHDYIIHYIWKYMYQYVFIIFVKKKLFVIYVPTCNFILKKIYTKFKFYKFYVKI